MNDHPIIRALNNEKPGSITGRYVVFSEDGAGEWSIAWSGDDEQEGLDAYWWETVQGRQPVLCERQTVVMV